MKSLVFTNSKPTHSLESKSYDLTEVTLTKGRQIKGFQLNIVSFIGPVKSDIPYIFTELPETKFLNHEKTKASVLVKLRLIDKRDIKAVMTPPKEEGDFEIIIHYVEP